MSADRTTTQQSVGTKPPPNLSTQWRGANRYARRLGLWSAILSAVFSVAFTIAALLIAPLPEWRGVRAYAETVKPIDQLSAYPSLFLAATFTVVMACIYIYASEEKKIFGLVGLAFGILYATMATINYSIQLVAVRQSLISGEAAGMEMFPMSQNTHSIFFALMNSYVYMCLAMFFAAFVFEGGDSRDGPDGSSSLWVP